MNEDWDDMAFAEPLAGEELERLLARYARVRLDPSHAQAKRARSAVMEEAWRRRIEANQVVPMRRPARHVPFSGWGVRRFGAAMTAAMVAGLMLGTSAFASSRAGGPLYESRLAIEELGYPSELGARTDALVAAADIRLSEALAASAHHDDGGTVAALQAYDRTLADIEVTAKGPAADRAVIEIQQHHKILEDIAKSAPAAAVAGLDRAIRNSDRVVQLMLDAGTGAGNSGSNGVTNGTAGNGSNNGNGVNNPGKNPGNGVGPGVFDPTATPDETEAGTASPSPKPIGKPTEDPAATPRPTRTPRPAATPKPAATETPARTRRPQPSHAGGPGGNNGGGGNQGEERTPRQSKPTD
jgi:hypothetical protein